MSRPWLPNLLRDLADTVGLDAATRFAQQYGGRRLYVPSKADPAHRIAQAVGLPILEWLVERYGGLDVLIPLGTAAIMAQRQALALALLAEGKSAPEAARLSGLHTRTIERMLRRARDSRQTDMFAR